MKNKTCVTCKKNQPVKMFYKTNRQPDGYDYYCKECRKSSTLRSHRGGKRKPKCEVENCNIENYALKMCKMHYERTRRNGTPDLANYRRESYNGQPYERVRENHLRRVFKLSTAQYEEMAKDGCEICGKQSLNHKKLHVDHDWHCCPVPKTSGKNYGYYKTCGDCIRGILCDKCNGTVGLFEKGRLREDYPDRDKIINYLAKYNQIISDRMIQNGKSKQTRSG